MTIVTSVVQRKVSISILQMTTIVTSMKGDIGDKDTPKGMKQTSMAAFFRIFLSLLTSFADKRKL